MLLLLVSFGGSRLRTSLGGERQTDSGAASCRLSVPFLSSRRHGYSESRRVLGPERAGRFDARVRRPHVLLSESIYPQQEIGNHEVFDSAETQTPLSIIGGCRGRRNPGTTGVLSRSPAWQFILLLCLPGTLLTNYQFTDALSPAKAGTHTTLFCPREERSWRRKQKRCVMRTASRSMREL